LGRRAYERQGSFGHEDKNTFFFVPVGNHTQGLISLVSQFNSFKFLNFKMHNLIYCFEDRRVGTVKNLELFNSTVMNKDFRSAMLHVRIRFVLTANVAEVVGPVW
jgi:hypothetical protein